MHASFTHHLVQARTAELRSDARRARLVRAASAGRSPAHPRRRHYVIGALFAVCASLATGIGVVASATPASQATTPNDCIRLNGGDYNACNVGNSGRGDLPYRPVSPNRSTPTHRPATPNDCIRLNGGDYNACNVGNSGRGDLPYRPLLQGYIHVSKANRAVSVQWSGPAVDGGYRCLRDTGGASGQCDAEMGLGPWHVPASDSGYRCLRDTGGASGQCSAAEGLLSSHHADAQSSV